MYDAITKAIDLSTRLSNLDHNVVKDTSQVVKDPWTFHHTIRPRKGSKFSGRLKRQLP